MTATVDRRDVLDAMERARAYVSAGWTQDGYCDRLDGQDVSLEEVFEGTIPEEGTRFCAAGALRLAIGQKFGSLTGEGTGELFAACSIALTDTDACGCLSFITFNDRPDTTQSMVLAMFDEAIAMLESEVARGS
jgi:hypothetical protein